MEPITNAEGILGTLGLTLKNLVAGAIGSFVSLRFFDPPPPSAPLKTWERWTTFIGGWAMGSWLSAPITEMLGQKPAIETGIALLIGLFGMALTSKVIQIIKDTDWVDLAQSIVKIIRGGGSG